MDGTLARPKVPARRAAAFGRMDAARARYWRDTCSAYLFVLPFLAVYTLLLVYPFFKNIWIST
jgi:ABC-type sugar transport system permease subunit